MTPGEKCRLYQDLGELIQSGMSLPRAVEKLSQHSRGRTHSLLRRMSKRLSDGEPFSDVIRSEKEIEPVDSALFAASERAGRLERGLKMAGDYYAALAEARKR